MNDDNPKAYMIALFTRIHSVVQSVKAVGEGEEETYSRVHLYANLLHNDQPKEHLPIPVFSYIKPTIGVSFLLYIMLSMGRFATEIDLTLHQSIRECFRYAKMIGPENDEDSLTSYTKTMISCA